MEGEEEMEKAEGITQRTCMNGPRTWTTVWGMTGSRGWAGRRRAKGENRDNCNGINKNIKINKIKIFNKKELSKYRRKLSGLKKD